MPRSINRVRFLALLFATLIFTTSANAQDDKLALPNSNLVPLDAPVVIILRPAAFLKLPEIKAVFDEFVRRDEIKKVVDLAEPESVEEIIIVQMSRDFKPGDSEVALVAGGAVIVKTNKPREWKALAAAAQLPITKATHAGIDYFYFRMGEAAAPIVFGFFQPNDKTVILASETNLRKMIEGIKAGGAAKTPKIAGTTPITVAAAAVDFRWIRDLFNPQVKRMSGGASVSFAVIGPIWEKTDYVTVHLDAADREKFTLTAEDNCADEDGAKSVEKTIEALLTLGRNVAPEFLKMVRVERHDNPALSEFATMAEQLLKSASVSREGTRVRCQVSVKADVAKLVRMLH